MLTMIGSIAIMIVCSAVAFTLLFCGHPNYAVEFFLVAGSFFVAAGLRSCEGSNLT